MLLGSLGIDESRLVTGTTRANVLYHPAGTFCGGGGIFPIHTLAEIYRKSMKNAKGKRNIVILIQRSAKRWFANHNQILSGLLNSSARYQYNVRVYSDKSLPGIAATKEMFYNAFLVVAPHGAGLANLFFTQPGTFVVESLCIGSGGVGEANYCYGSLAHSLGLRYYSHLRQDSCKQTTFADLKPAVSEAMQMHFEEIISTIEIQRF